MFAGSERGNPPRMRPGTATPVQRILVKMVRDQTHHNHRDLGTWMNIRIITFPSCPLSFYPSCLSPPYPADCSSPTSACSPSNLQPHSSSSLPSSSISIGPSPSHPPDKPSSSMTFPITSLPIPLLRSHFPPRCRVPHLLVV